MEFQGLGAVVGAISRNLHELQDRQGSYLSIYDQPALPLQVSLVSFTRICSIALVLECNTKLGSNLKIYRNPL